MRQTQYIGLTRQARKFVKQFTPILNHSNKTTGMFNENVPLGMWIGVNQVGKGVLIQEVVQDNNIPWDSGPIIFTFLKVKYLDAGTDTVFPVTTKNKFKWKSDRNIANQFDYETGKRWFGKKSLV